MRSPIDIMTPFRVLFGPFLVPALALMVSACGAPSLREAHRPPPRPIDRPMNNMGVPVSDMPVKIGKPYQVAGIWYYPEDRRDYDEVGLASWYGPQFHGAATANGERFDMDRVGAAHKTLPLPSYVEVTSLENGRTILVRVNDRGPFVNDRIIDLSRRSAQLLGIERKGVSRVRVRRVYPIEPDRVALRSGRPAAPRPAVSGGELASLNRRFEAGPIPVAAPKSPLLLSPGSIAGYYVQVAAVSDQARAEDIAEILAARIEQIGSLWRVRLGPYQNEGKARDVLARLQSRGYQEARLIRYADETPASSEWKSTP